MYQTVSQLLNNPLKLVYLNEQYMQETFKFKDHDIQFLKLFWQPDFDESWFLLDEPFIETWLIQDTNLNLHQLYQHILFTMFHKDADYKLSLETNPESMYMVKGYCLKDLCIICNKIFRAFFIKLGRVAHMLVLTKSVEETSTQIKLNRTSRQLDALSRKTDNLTFLIEEIVSERVAEVTSKVAPNSGCEEVVNLVRLPAPSELHSEARSALPVHLRGAGYVVIRCLRKNYAKHLNRVKSYVERPKRSADGGNNLMVEEVFSSPVANGGVDVVKELGDAGVKTHKNNGVSSDDHIALIEKVKTILKMI